MDIVIEINEIIKRVSLFIKLDFIKVSHSVLHNRLIQYDSSQCGAKTDVLGANIIEKCNKIKLPNYCFPPFFFGNSRRIRSKSQNKTWDICGSSLG